MNKIPTKLIICECLCHSPGCNFEHGALYTCCGTCLSCGAERQTRAHMIECHDNKATGK